MRDLAGGDFLEQQRNLVLIGGTGTGKTHIAVGIVRACIRGGARGRFFNVVDLVNKLEAEARASNQGRMADRLCRLDFVVLDELGYLPFAQTGGQLLFHLISRITRCTVERLMRSLGIQGAVRGKRAKTTISDKATPCPADRVNRRFQAPRPNVPSRVLPTRAASQAARPPADGRGVSDFTYVSAWQGFVYTAFVIDAFARRPIAGQRGLAGVAHGPLRRHWAGFVLDALEQALHERRPARRDCLIHHSDPSAVS